MAMTEEQKAALKARLQMQRPASAMTQATEKEIREYRKDPESVSQMFPTALVRAAVVSADVLMPEPLEKQVVKIAEMFLNGKKAPEIANALGLEERVVDSEIRRLEHYRSVALRDNEGLANKVIDEHFNVTQRSIKLIEQGQDILNMYADEMKSNHEKRLKADERDDPYAHKMGISPHQLQAFFLGVEALGKQKDRIAEIQGLLGKHIPEPTTQVNQTINNVTFNSDALNEMADALMKNAGHAVLGGQGAAQLAREMAHEQIIEAQVETIFPALVDPIQAT